MIYDYGIQRTLQKPDRLSGNNQRAKYYRLTRTGKKQLVNEQSKWKMMVKAIGRVTKPI
jgi:PadR family transcriptional regulator PadR